jgi:hypothetical protein
MKQNQMRITIFLFLIVIEINSFGQTDTLERIALNNKLISKEITESNYLNIRLQWNKMMKTNQYPDIPVDSSGQVHYCYINEFKNYDKEKLFNRTMEWLSINYGFVPSNYYSNLKDGKIILRNNLNLFQNLFQNYSCTFTLVFSVKDEKIRVDIYSLSYQVFSQGDYESGTPDNTINYNITDIYPVILKKQSEWPKYLLLFRATNKLLPAEIKNLNDYILAYDTSYTF